MVECDGCMEQIFHTLITLLSSSGGGWRMEFLVHSTVMLGTCVGGG